MVIEINMDENIASQGDIIYESPDKVFNSIISTKKILYKIDHYFAKEHLSYCIIVESNKTIKEMLEITSAIEFLFEDTVDESDSIDSKCLLRILCDHYDCNNVKDKYLKYLPYMNYDEWSMVTIYLFGDCAMVQIDLYSAREKYFTSDFKKNMRKYLPSDVELETLKMLLFKESEEERNK